MPASAVKKTKNKRKRLNFKSKKKLNPVLIQSDEILIFQYLPAKLQQFRDCRPLLRTPPLVTNFLAVG